MYKRSSCSHHIENVWKEIGWSLLWLFSLIFFLFFFSLRLNKEKKKWLMNIYPLPTRKYSYLGFPFMYFFFHVLLSSVNDLISLNFKASHLGAKFEANFLWSFLRYWQSTATNGFDANVRKTPFFLKVIVGCSRTRTHFIHSWRCRT